MNKTEFTYAIENPDSIKAEQIISLQGIIQEFPYFQSARIILTKAFLNAENIGFEQELKKTAAYVRDRKKLHQLLFAPSSTPTTIKEEPASVPSIDEVKLNTQDVVDVSSSPEEKEIIKKEEKLEVSEASVDIINQQILSSAISSSILLDVSGELPQPEELRFSSETASSVEFVETEIVENVEDTTAPDFNENQSHSFTEWLGFFKDEESASTEADNNTTDTPITTENKPISESFPVKKEFYSASKMAKLSVQEDGDLVTETLANIYADQEHFEKAIKAFQKLQLKYPEKRVYFAGRIKEIQIQLNQ